MDQLSIKYPTSWICQMSSLWCHLVSSSILCISRKPEVSSIGLMDPSWMLWARIHQKWRVLPISLMVLRFIINWGGDVLILSLWGKVTFLCLYANVQSPEWFLQQLTVLARVHHFLQCCGMRILAVISWRTSRKNFASFFCISWNTPSTGEAEPILNFLIWLPSYE